MKILVGILTLCACVCAGFAAGNEYAAEKHALADKASTPIRVELVMYDTSGAVTSRQYQGVTSWNYRYVGSEPTMQLGFLNPTIYRCGFEP